MLQDEDVKRATASEKTVVTETAPTDEQMTSLIFADGIAKHRLRTGHANAGVVEQLSKEVGVRR